MGVSDYNSADEGVIAGEGVMVTSIFAPCYGSSILEFWTEHECLMLWILYCSMSLAKEVMAEKEPILKVPLWCVWLFFRFLRKEEPRSGNFKRPLPVFWRNSGGFLKECTI